MIHLFEKNNINYMEVMQRAVTIITVCELFSYCLNKHDISGLGDTIETAGFVSLTLMRLLPVLICIEYEYRQ